MKTKEAIEFIEDICESLSKQCDSGSGSDDVDTVMMGIKANKVIRLLKRGEKYEKMWKVNMGIAMQDSKEGEIIHPTRILLDLEKLEQKHFPKEAKGETINKTVKSNQKT